LANFTRVGVVQAALDLRQRLDGRGDAAEGLERP
jgi:hypothetical protein